MTFCRFLFSTDALLGQGCAAKVYKGTDVSCGRPVAVKIYKDAGRTESEGTSHFHPFPPIVSLRNVDLWARRFGISSMMPWWPYRNALWRSTPCPLTLGDTISESRIPALVSRLGVDPWCRSATLECWKGSATLAAAHVQMRHNETILLVAVFWFKSAFTRAVAALCTAGCVCIASKTPSKLVASCIVPHVATARRRSWSWKATPRVLGESGAKIV